MIILDSYVVIAFLRGEPAAHQIAEILGGDEEMSLTALGVAEVLDNLIRITMVDEDEAVLDLAELELNDAIPVSSEIAMRAGILRARHYHRTARAVSLADCVAAEVARTFTAPLATSDPHLLDLCRDERITALPLPDGNGNTWTPDGRGHL